MSISLTIDLNDRDLAHFNNAMQVARKSAEGKAPEEVIEAASKLLVDAQKVHVPDFILQRLLQLDNMIAMVRDTAWAMSEEDKQRVLSALVKKNDKMRVIILADVNVRYKYLEQVLISCALSKVKDFNFQTKPGKDRPTMPK